MDYANRIRTKLTAALTPSRLVIIDESARHAGHAGADPKGETHFDVTVVSVAFTGMTRVNRQRMVYDLLKTELAERIHALSLKTITPSEDL